MGTCNKQEERKVERGDTKTSQYTNSSWAVFCGWQAVANMQTACSAISYGDDSTDVSVDSAVFSPEKPSSSNNLDPSTDYADRVQYGYVMGEKMDGCNLHAFCSACTEDDGTTINSNCKALVDKYGKGALYDVTSFFNSMESFWCTDSVQGHITNGTFAAGNKCAGRLRVRRAAAPFLKGNNFEVVETPGSPCCLNDFIRVERFWQRTRSDSTHFLR